MIKQLRRKFIAVAMSAILLVLGSIIAVMNVVNYLNVVQNADYLLQILAENNGVFPREDRKRNDGGFQGREMTPETPFETRYFTVLLQSNGTVVSADTGRIAAVSTATAQEYAKTLYQSGKHSGFLEKYRFNVLETNSGQMYIFLDCGKEFSSFYAFLLASVFVSLGGILVIFLLVLLFSKLAVKPFAENYEKQKRFITDASHEIKTPLTIIDASTEVLEMEQGESSWTASIKNQVKRLSALTDQLVFLSHMDEENHMLQKIDFPLSDILLETAQSFQAVAEAQGKTLLLEIQPNLSYYGEAGSIVQLLSILLDNAMKYSDGAGQIFLRLKQVGKNREITVENTVAQLPQGNLNMLFERFYRADSSRSTETGGYGIGLSAAKAIVTAHKGKISAQSKEKNHIVFKILL